MAQKRSKPQIVKPTAIINIGASFADLIALPPVARTGEHDIIAKIQHKKDSGGGTEGAVFRIAIDGNPIIGTGSTDIDIIAAAFTNYNIVTIPINSIYLKKGQVVSVQGQYDTSAPVVDYAALLRESYLQIVRR